jgi:hypothetical protein
LFLHYPPPPPAERGEITAWAGASRAICATAGADDGSDGTAISGSEIEGD